MACLCLALSACREKQEEDAGARVAKSGSPQVEGRRLARERREVRPGIHDGLATRSWKVPADFVRLLHRKAEEAAKENGQEDDLFGAIVVRGWHFGDELKALSYFAIEFPPGAACHLDPWKGELVVINTEENLARVDEFLASLKPMEMFVLDPELFHRLGLRRDDPATRMAQQAATAEVERKLREIIIPVVDFEDTTVEEAIDFLRKSARDLDPAAREENGRGIRFTIKRPNEVDLAGSTGDPELDREGGLESIDPGLARVKELKLRNVPVATVLQYLCEKSRLRYKIDHTGVTMLVVGSGPEEFEERRWRVDPAVMERLLEDVEEREEQGPAELDPFGDDEIDPFADDPVDSSTRGERSWIELLKESGIDFYSGASLEYNEEDRVLAIRNHPEMLEFVESVLTDQAIEVSRERALGR